MLFQFATVYITIGLMYTMAILSIPDEQVKTELLLAGMEIPPEHKHRFRFMIAAIMAILWPLDMVVRSRM